ncbi:hypothetical protein PsorP6_003272 [Peronosclerospora sorghi]|uniref:Uncharacterized protein n=1 Tax=Peronosclerospora sorghi TaxID=230839 RepID=A0ACC0VMV9_9STRA|nr:hypothetical protein PsorP6_003272 [Peronosclerospora sorghi]
MLIHNQLKYIDYRKTPTICGVTIISAFAFSSPPGDAYGSKLLQAIAKICTTTSIKAVYLGTTRSGHNVQVDSLFSLAMSFPCPLLTTHQVLARCSSNLFFHIVVLMSALHFFIRSGDEGVC